MVNAHWEMLEAYWSKATVISKNKVSKDLSPSWPFLNYCIANSRST